MFEPHFSVRFIFLNSDKRSPRAGVWMRGWRLEGVASINILALTSKNRPWPREFKKDVYASLASRAIVVLLYILYVCVCVCASFFF